MKVYISGVMQGSKRGLEIQDQEYRQVISDAIKIYCPNAEIVDPFLLFPDTAAFDDQRTRKVLFMMADQAASADIVIAYLPEASMGTTLEMTRAYDNGKVIISISPMENNWFIRAVSATILPSLDDFCTWINKTQLTELVPRLRSE